MGLLDYEPTLAQAVLDELRPVVEPMGIEVQSQDRFDDDTMQFSLRWGSFGWVSIFPRQWIVDQSIDNAVFQHGPKAVQRAIASRMAKVLIDGFSDAIIKALKLNPEWLRRAGLSVPLEQREDADIEEHIIGYRVWKVAADGRLLPIGAGGDVWHGNAEIRAACVYGGNHKSPAPSWTDCHCGLNAYSTPEIALSREPTGILGVVAARGEVEVHADGFRAEFMRPLALVELPGRMTPKPMGVPLVDTIDELVEFGRLYGVEVPEELRPDPSAQWNNVGAFPSPPVLTGAYGLYQIAPAEGWKRVGDALNRFGLEAADAGRALQQFNAAVGPDTHENEWTVFTSADSHRYDRYVRMQFGLGITGPNSASIIKGITS